MAQSSTASTGIIEINSAVHLNESISGDEVALVYFSFGAKSAENPHSLGDEFDAQFEEFAESGEVVPKLFRAMCSPVTAQFFADLSIDPLLGGSLVLWKQGAVLARASIKELNESSEVETEVVRWLAGKYPAHSKSQAQPSRPASAASRKQTGQTVGASGAGSPTPPPPPPNENPSTATNVVLGAALAGPPPGPKAIVPGQTPGTMCGAPPAGPPPGPRTAPGQPTTMTIGAALSGPPPGPKAIVPGQTPGTMCGAPPAGPPPGPRTAPGQPTTMTVGAALSGPPPGPKAIVPGQTPGTMCGAPPAGPPPGSRTTVAAPEPPSDPPEAASPPPPPPPAPPQEDFPPPPPKVITIKDPETPCPMPPVPKVGQIPAQPPEASAPLASSAKQAPVLEDKDIDPPNEHTDRPVEKMPLARVDAVNGPRVFEAAPEPPSNVDVDSADDSGERIAKLFASHGKHSTSRDTMKALLQFLLTKQGSRNGLRPSQLDRIVDAFIEESDSANGMSAVDVKQFIHWTWSGAKSRN